MRSGIPLNPSRPQTRRGMRRAQGAGASVTLRATSVRRALPPRSQDQLATTRTESSGRRAPGGGAQPAVETLVPLVQPVSRPRLAVATAALDKFVGLNAQIMALSRRNTNVRSLALALNQKGKITGACEQSLRALRDALAKRGFTSTR